MKNNKIVSNMIFKKVTSILKRYGAKEISIFGSYVRDEEKKTSDLDIIIEFSERKSLFDIVGIE